MRASPPFLLDTNIVLELVRGGSRVADLEANYALLTAASGAVYVPFIVRAELSVFERDWGANRRDDLRRVLRGLNTLSRFDDELLAAYSDIDWFSRRSAGRRMGKNDLWIAATAQRFGMTLITSDNDFAHLAGIVMPVELVAVENAVADDDR